LTATDKHCAASDLSGAIPLLSHLTMTSALGCAAVVSADPRFWDCPTIDAHQHIAESLGSALTLPDHLADALADQWVTDCEPALCRWFARLTHRTYQQVHRDNTYNSDNDFDRNFVFSIFAPEDCADWCWSEDVFVVIETHLGGDVRGNYGPAAVFRVDSLADSGFLDWVCGWFASPINTASVGYLADCEHPELRAANDRLSIGYSSHPTSELRELLWQGCEPIWSERFGCYLGRLADVPFAVRLEPTAPYYC
jgi:hypothetical protein